MADFVEKLEDAIKWYYFSQAMRGVLRHKDDQIATLRAEVERLTIANEGITSTVRGYVLSCNNQIAELTRLKAEVERLTAENKELREYNSTVLDPLATLRASNERLVVIVTTLLSRLSGAKKLTRDEAFAMEKARADLAALTAPAKETDNE